MNQLFKIVVRKLKAEEKAQLKIKQDAVVITQIKQGFGIEVGLLKSDIITKLNDVEVTSANKLDEITANLKAGSFVSIRIIRAGHPRFLAFKIKK